MRPIVFAFAAALLVSTAGYGATRPLHKKPAETTSALPGTFHFGRDPATGKFKRLTAKQVAPKTPGTAALEYDARRDGTGPH